jgi:dTDP-4-dehydrorhamnose reductase
VRDYSQEHSVLGVSTSSTTSIPTSVRYRRFQCDVLADQNAFLKNISKLKPSIIINCAALADIGLCEQYPDKAFRLNALLPEQLGGIARDFDAGFIHISSDAFFGGPSRIPHDEFENPCPLNVYGQTKLEGEHRVISKNPNALVVRTNIVGFRDRKGSPTFAEWLCRSLSEEKDIALADDFVASSIHVDFLTELMIQAHTKGAKGLLNIASRDSASKYLFGKLLAESLGANFENVKKIAIRDLNLIPPRAPYIALDVSKGEALLGKRFPEISFTIQRLAADFKIQISRRTLHG